MAETEAIEPLKIDADLWSHRDLLERIIGRWFHIIEEMNDVEIGWQVEVKNQQVDPEIALSQLNQHLNRLSWIALLQQGNPFDLIIMPKPPQVQGLSVGQMAAVWFVFTSFLTLAGAAWLQHQDSTPKLTDPDLLLHSLCWFALPIALVMGIGSELRRLFALNAGVNLGHHIPLAVPFLMTPAVPIWPFGVIGFTSQRRMEFLSFKDRKSLATVSMIAPLIMVVAGILFTVIGYMMTSNSSPIFGSSPISVSPSWVSELILGMSITEDEFMLRSSWLHPLGLAGISLNTMGWILLLPLPGFPGDRLLSALLNPGEMEEGGTQTWLFVAVLVAGMYTILSGGYWPWLVLIVLGAWRRFSPEASSTPFVLNEAKEFSDRTKNAFSILLVSILLLGFPGMMPVQELEDWDGGLDTSQWPTEFTLSQDENLTIQFPLTTIGVMEGDFDFEFRVNGSLDSVLFSEISEECHGDSELISELACRFNEVGPLSDQALSFTLHPQNINQNPIIKADLFSLEIIWEENLELNSHTVNFSFQSSPIPTEMIWRWDGDSDTPTYCINMTHHIDTPGNLTIESNPHDIFTFDGSKQIPLEADEDSTICIDGVYGTHDLMRTSEIETYLFTTLDDGSVYRSRVIFDAYLNLPGGHWPASVLSNAYPLGTSSMEAVYLMWFEESPESTICPFSRVQMSIPTDENGTWQLNMSEITEITLPQDLKNGTILLPNHGTLIACSTHQTAWVADLSSSNGILHDGINVGNTTVDVRVEITNFGINHDWNLSDFSLSNGESIPELSYANGTGIVQIVWAEPTLEEWTLHLITHCTNSQGCQGGDS